MGEPQPVFVFSGVSAGPIIDKVRRPLEASARDEDRI